MRKMQGPGIFLAQFLREEAPFNSLDGLAAWAAEKGYLGLQIPTWDARTIDLDTAAESKAYCDDYRAKLQEHGLAVTELAAPLQGQVLAIHPAYEAAFQPFYPQGLDDPQRVEWATAQLGKVIRTAAHMETKTIPALTGGLAWHMAYPWPQRPPGLIGEAFRELARRWKPLLDQARQRGLTFAFEPHPGSDVFDGATYERFLEATGNHPAACLNYDPSHFVLQQLDYLAFIQIYGARITGFHVKDAEFRPTGRAGVYGGYAGWRDRAGRFRSPGDGQVDFTRVFTLLTEAGYDGWAVLEWECCVKSPAQGAAEGAPFIQRHLIQPTNVAFDDFAGGTTDTARNRRILGLDA
jgi:sugar phosphate isomerase/epimerase